MYHGFFADDEPPAGSIGPRSYSMPLDMLGSHLRALERELRSDPSTCWDMVRAARPGPYWGITFDDGDDSALAAAELVEALGWRAHFFIVSSWIGQSHSLTSSQVIDLRARGHVIGTHSVSHPDPMSGLSRARILKEWRQSAESLADLLGEPVTVGSVPGGSVSRQVISAAVEAGIEILFTSEPVAQARLVDGCTVIGRYAIQNGHSACAAAELAAGTPLPCASQWVSWNSRKVARKVLGTRYYRMRKRVLGFRGGRRA